MAGKKLTLWISAIALLFVLLGDRILPSPLNTYSFQARSTLNQFLIGLLPKFQPQTPDAKTEEAVNDLHNQP